VVLGGSALDATVSRRRGMTRNELTRRARRDEAIFDVLDGTRILSASSRSAACAPAAGQLAAVERPRPVESGKKSEPRTRLPARAPAAPRHIRR